MFNTAIARRARCLSGRSLISTLARVLLLVVFGLACVYFLPSSPIRSHVHRQHLVHPQLRQNDPSTKVLEPVKNEKIAERRKEEIEEKKWSYPIHLELELPDKYLNDPVLQSPATMMRQYGFNLKNSNSLSLTRKLSDVRHPDCKKIRYPDNMPKASVIIIYFNEPLSTLLRNIMSVLNRSPPHLLGEIVLVDDNSTLAELSELPKHLEKLPKKVVVLLGECRFNCEVQILIKL